MKIYTEKVIDKKEKIIEYSISSCYDCGSENVDLFNYEDTFGYISGGKCKNCKREIKSNWGELKSEAAEIWNAKNDFNIIIRVSFNNLKKEIDGIFDLKEMAQSRKIDLSITNENILRLLEKIKYTINKKED